MVAPPGTPHDGDEHLTLFLDLVQQINTGATPEHVFGLVADALRQIFGIDRFALVLMQPDGTLAVTQTRGLSERYMEEAQRHLKESAGARALARRRAVYIPDATTSPEFHPLGDAAREEGFRTVVILPFLAGAEPSGYLIMYHNRRRIYTQAEIALAQAMAQQAGFSMQHARLYAATEQHRSDLEQRFQRRVAEAEAIDEIMLHISSSLNLDSTLQAITDAAATLSGGVTSAMYLREADGRYHAKSAYGVPLDRLQEIVLSPADGLLRQMIESGQPVQVTDFEEAVKSVPEAFKEVRRIGVRATLGTPLMEESECVGALYVASLRSEPFPAETTRILRRLASFARVAIWNARRFLDVEEQALERERARSQMLAELLELSVYLNSELSTANLIERVVEAAMALVGARSGTLGLVEGEALVFHRFHTPEGWVEFEKQLQRGEGAPGHVWATEQPYVANDSTADSHVLHDVQELLGFQRLAAVPVVSRGGNVIGTLSVYDPLVDRDFGQKDVEALQLLAHQVSIALENARLNEMKDAFLSIVSHELKTPVTSIKGFTQMLQRRLPPEALERAGKYLRVINQQTDRLTTLINDLLDLSRIQTGRFHFDLADLEYAEIVRDIASETQMINPENTITVRGAESVHVSGNANRLRQVLVNLLDNAVKYGPHRGTIDVAIEVQGDHLLTRVVDEGHGLTLKDGDRIFTPYYQLDRETHIAGLGLGLYISRQIVDEHGGRIWLEGSSPTAFCFSLPLTS